MKTSEESTSGNVSSAGRLDRNASSYREGKKLVLTFAALAILSAWVANAADISWINGTASYTNAPAWSGGTVPGQTDNAIHDNGSNNVVQINAGNPDWTLNQIRAGNAGNSGAFAQSGQTVTLTNGTGRGAVRLGVVASGVGVYSLSGGALNYSGEFNVGEVGTGVLNLSGGSINGSGNLSINVGSSLDAVTATVDGGTNKTGFTWFELGLYAPDPTRGVPNAGSTFASQSDANYSYTMAPSFAVNNSLLVSAGVPNATATLSSPTACTTLSFLGSAGNGAVNANYVVHHADSSTETGTLAVLDWFATNAPAWFAGGRVPANGLGFQILSAPNNPRLFSLDITLTNTTSAVTSVDLAYASGGVACLLALSGSSGGTFNPLTITGYNADMIIEAGAPIYSAATDYFTQTAGDVNLTGQLWVGNFGAGIYNLSGGSANVTNWFVVGRSGGNGTMNMTGGTVQQVSGGQPAFIVGDRAGTDNSVGTLNHSAGTINTIGSEFWIGNGATAQGTNNMSGTAVLNVNNWIAVGRGGIGVLNLSSGAVTKTGNGNITMAAFGGTGIINQNGGAITNTTSQTWIGETAAATWNLNSGPAILGVVHIVQLGGAQGTMNLNGGLLRATEITTGNVGGLSTINFNGGTLQAAGDNPTFLHDLTLAFVMSGGAVIDSQGFNIGASQPLFDGGGGGGLTKSGAGTLTLSGANNYTGATTVNAGKVITSTASSGGGDYTAADGAGLGVNVELANGQLNSANVTLASSTAASLDFDLGPFGNPTLAPLNVTGNLAVNGTITVNIADALPQVGQFPLIKYTTRTGGGNFVIGTIPVGTVAQIVTNIPNSSIDLNLISVNLPRWDGQAGGNWDIGLTTNWVNSGTGLPTLYGEGNFVVFDDNALGTTTVNLVSTVNPGSLTANNVFLTYTLVGTGKISGPIGFTKPGAGIFIMGNSGGNNFTGPTVLAAGTLVVSNLANGGLPSPIGASSANPTNLVLQNGALSYAGSPVSINRGYSVQGTNSAIDVQGNLTLSGQVVSANGAGFRKTGPAQLAYTGVGSNILSGTTSYGYWVQNGAVVFDGSAGSQTNVVLGLLRVGDSNTLANASISLTNTRVLVTGNMELGNNSGATGTLTLNSNSLLTVQGNPLVVGRNSSSGVVIHNAGTLDSRNELWIGQGTGGIGSYTFTSGTMLLSNWLAIGRANSSGAMTMTGGTITKAGGGNFIVGTGAGNNTLNSVGVFDFSGGTINCNSEYWVAENVGTRGTNTISGTAVLNLNNWMSIGRGGTGVVNFISGTINRQGAGSAFIVGDGGRGLFNHSGGTLTSANELWIGQGGAGVGEYNLSGSAVVTVNNWVAIGRGGGNGTLNISGGTIAKNGTTGNHFIIGTGTSGTVNQTGGTITNTIGDFWLAENNIGTWNMSAGQAILDILRFTINASGRGTLNLNGGVLAVNQIAQGNASGQSTNNMNGGTIKARSSNASFMQGLKEAKILASGVTIDSDVNVIGIAQPLLDGGGGGGLTKIGNGTLRLNGVNTYTGTTLVSAGTLGGTGTIAGPVTVASGATLAPGNSIGTLTVNNALTLSIGSTTFAEVSLTGGVTNNDQVAGLTGVSYAGSLVVSNVGSSPIINGVFKLFNSAAPGSGNFSSVNVPTGFGSFNPATGELTIITPFLNQPAISGANLILTGTGLPGAGYTILTSTNVAVPLALWTTNTTGIVSGSGTISNAVPLSATGNRFFILRQP